MIKKAILITLTIELFLTAIAFHLMPDAPIEVSIFLLACITIVSVCFGIGIYKQLKEVN